MRRASPSAASRGGVAAGDGAGGVLRAREGAPLLAAGPGLPVPRGHPAAGAAAGRLGAAQGVGPRVSKEGPPKGRVFSLAETLCGAKT